MERTYSKPVQEFEARRRQSELATIVIVGRS
jgi:hypothetical protein